MVTDENTPIFPTSIQAAATVNWTFLAILSQAIMMQGSYLCMIGSRLYLELDQLATAACQLLLRDLTEAEWQTYLPNLPYRATCP